MNAKLLSGNELFTYSLASPPPKKTLKNFWSWYSSDLLNNTLRGALAEYIVAIALGIEFTCARDDWSEYLITDDGIKVEVKCSAYLQSWKQNKLSDIRFGCGPSQAFVNQQYDGVSIRHSDIYVFCVFDCKDRESANVLNLDQWVFYILPTYILNEKLGLQKTISLHSLLKLNPYKAYFHEISTTVYNIHNAMENI